jgi:hypothetical protein
MSFLEKASDDRRLGPIHFFLNHRATLPINMNRLIDWTLALTVRGLENHLACCLVVLTRLRSLSTRTYGVSGASFRLRGVRGLRASLQCQSMAAGTNTSTTGGGSEGSPGQRAWHAAAASKTPSPRIACGARKRVTPICFRDRNEGQASNIWARLSKTIRFGFVLSYASMVINVNFCDNQTAAAQEIVATKNYTWLVQLTHNAMLYKNFLSWQDFQEARLGHRKFAGFGKVSSLNNIQIIQDPGNTWKHMEIHE